LGLTCYLKILMIPMSTLLILKFSLGDISPTTLNFKQL